MRIIKKLRDVLTQDTTLARDEVVGGGVVLAFLCEYFLCITVWMVFGIRHLTKEMSVR